MRKVTIILALVAVTCIASDAFGRGSTKCRGCHTPHRAGPEITDPKYADAYGVPLWDNRNLGDGLINYDPYVGSQKFQDMGIVFHQPDGPSRLCLGCHDGSSYYKTAGFNAASGTARSHPISFVYDDILAGKSDTLKPPSTTPSGLPGGRSIAEDLLDSKGKMQCTSCHNVHNTGVTTTTVNHHDPGSPAIGNPGDPGYVPAVPADSDPWNPVRHMYFDTRVKLCQVCHNK
jgi:hypothetical protein